MARHDLTERVGLGSRFFPCLAVLVCAVLAAGEARGGIFTDDFSGGINPTFWTPFQTTPGLYSIDGTNGDVRFAIVGNNPGGRQNVGLMLNLGALTPSGKVSGDFDFQVDFRNAVIGPGLDQVQLHSYFGSPGPYFMDVRDNSGGPNVHVWIGAVRGGFPTAATSGTFRISRSGSAVSGYFEGSLIWSANFTLNDLDRVEFILQNNNSSNDRTSVTFDNFSLTAADVNVSAIPEPATLTLLGLGVAALARRRRAKKRDLGPSGVRL
ncbi:MAG TPA: PEP-CTERM sorting domain-containing protein [Planctomycetota bacterium]|nr:PEP-CTERM sorting domain-containing protein [Planctomycetota bacterium]